MSLCSFTTQSKPVDDVCSHWSLQNGVAFFSHQDCDKFIQCYQYGLGKVVGVVQQCGFGTEWNQDLLTCVASSISTCPPSSDKCYQLTNGEVRKAVGNCRGFWVCNNGDSVPKCCPMGQYYNETTGCTDVEIDTECNARCFNDYPFPDKFNGTTEMTTTTKKPCLIKRIVPDIPMQYEEYIVGLGWISRPCPAGLLYVQDDCECTKVVAVSKPSACSREIYLPFNNSHYDQSGKNNYILNENVVVANGKAVFNGYTSQLVIPRFTNVDASTIVVKVLYTSDHEKLTQSQTILSNSNCDQGSSIVITEGSGTVNYTVGTMKGETIFENTVSVPQTASQEKDIVFSFNKGVLKGKLGNNEMVLENQPGHLRSVRCALHIGNSDNVSGGWFKGAIEELSIYLCA
ncbi:protein PIF-like [Dreissena polymorpha]|nr:protein PIF-like [Dreissena polymorpha]